MISLKTTTGIYNSSANQSNKTLSSYRQIQWLNIDFDNLFLLPKCAFDSHRKVFLRRDLARYNFNINIVADTPKGNVWISGNKDSTNMQQQQQCRPGSASSNNRDHYSLHKEREERIKQLKEKQNEDRQRKLEDLKAQALATQKFREQKDEERKRRMEDLKSRDNEKRHQVEERKKAIWEAEKERREYILRKNQERDQRLETKRKNERSQIAFAFGSSTPRMLDNELGSAWAYRRANSIQNVACNTSISPMTRRSSERELGDGSAKKRATSASGLDRQCEAHKRMSSSMHEVFHWGPKTSAAPTKLSLSVAGSQIDFEGPPSPRREASRYSARNRHSMVMVESNKNHDDSYGGTGYYSVHRRKTDLMPTIPSPRDTCRSSLGTPMTPRTPGRAFSMTRLDQLAKPHRKNGEHIFAILERERKQAEDLEQMSKMSLSQGTSPSNQDKRKSRSMSQLSGRVHKSSRDSSRQNRYVSPLQRKNGETTRSMTQLSGGPPIEKRATSKPGLRSGEITPKSLSASRPGSAMSTSTTNSGVVNRRTAPVRKPRPLSIAGTGVTVKEEKPQLSTSTTTPSKPIKRPSTAVAKTPSDAPKPTTRASSAKTTPKVSTPTSEVAPKITKQTVVVKETVAAVAIEDCKDEKTIINSVIVAEQKHTESTFCENNDNDITDAQQEPLLMQEVMQSAVEVVNQVVDLVEHQQNASIEEVEMKIEEVPPVPMVVQENILESADMTASMIAKTKITTEEEAKAAITERRRLAREEAERQAELERKRVEEQEALERQKQLEEEEQHRQMEAEALRLAEEQRKMEHERLQQAIEENKKREEEEKKRKEDEERQKLEREQAEEKARKAREDAEKLKAEMLKKEEIERLERKKRVEAIMARTRKGAAGTPSKNDESVDLTKSQTDLMSQSETSPEQSIAPNQSQQQQQEIQPDQNDDYERSVTEKENLLMSSFNKLGLNGNGLNNNMLETNNNLNLLNGKDSTDLILGTDGVVATNGHDKGSIESTFENQTSELPIDNTTNDQDKLIDFGGDVAIASNDHTSTNLNNNNFIDSNSSLITHSNLNVNNNLVAASDTNVERDLSLL